jgi:hypothetical protein
MVGWQDKKKRGATGRKNKVFATAPLALHRPLVEPGGPRFAHPLWPAACLKYRLLFTQKMEEERIKQ